MKRTLVAALALLSAACTPAEPPVDDDVAQVSSAPDSPPLTATADLIDAEGRNVGQVVLEQDEEEVDVRVRVEGLSPGTHAIHLHQVGTCTPPDFASAGGHFNPGGGEHGLENPRGPHNGDLLNIEVDESGAGSFELENDRVTLSEGPNAFLDADGAAVVIHAGPDDYLTGPTGEGGMARIACGVFARQ